MIKNSFIYQKVNFALMLLFLLSSCVGQGNKQAINLYYDDVKLGESSLNILKTYGLSDKRWEDKSGNNVVSYSYSKPQYNISSFLPWQKSSSKFTNYEVILIFNQEGKLTKVKKFIGELKVKSWLICENAVADCFVDSAILNENISNN